MNGNVLRSAIDHALINKPTLKKNCYKIDIDYSGHNMICVDTNVQTWLREHITTVHGRDYRKLRSNPGFFLKQLANIQWEVLSYKKDVDDMEGKTY